MHKIIIYLIVLFSCTKLCISEPLAWAFYFPWYNDSYWNMYTFKDCPSYSLYSSKDVKIIDKQMKNAKNAGIDGFFVIWDSPYSYLDSTINGILCIAQLNDMKIAIYDVTQRSENPNGPNEVVDHLTYVLEHYVHHPAYYKERAQPWIGIFNTDRLPLDSWRKAAAHIKSKGHDPKYMGSTMDSTGVFSAYHVFAIFSYNENNLIGFYDSSKAWTIKNNIYWAATVQPGDDERMIPERGGLYRERKNGEYYKSTFKAAINSKPEWILITTWNEWPEHSYIEPSVKYGNKYLKITKKYLKCWKKNGGN